MIFHKTKLDGAYIVELERKEDDRGFFARAYCENEFVEQGLRGEVAQANLWYTHRRGTVRGMHFQVPPASETKYIRCVRGAVWDVIIDLRPDSQTYLQHIGVELSAENRRAIYVPACFAHGNQALSDGAELLYFMSTIYTPGCERGVRYDDPAVGILWPLPVALLSEKDKLWPLLPKPTALQASSDYDKL